ncbi:HBR554Wp [Eremothecium sinecaudum]|uniref:Cytosolic Fe-S cluster assembly factor NAR1 n=1 Tax=Eremothecium sinecaudum TaxID=45286 RepID=A0A120K1J6_9SACH|nr:HBR554Wp [Eremothecium sinecaudum]AMD19455.1 HBR554Wp [Eremothecium sinecaudum]
MSLKFSEGDLNDFISPGASCVKSTRTTKSTEHVKSDTQEIEVGKEPSELEKVSITLEDCLACSGCITSSEELLLSRQSHTVFLEAHKQLAGNRTLVVSVAPQVRLSLAHYFGMSQNDSDRCLVGVLESYFGARFVVGTQVGRSITVQQTNEALGERAQKGEKKPVLCSVCPGFVLYAEKTKPGLVPYLLDVKSPQQITGALLKDVVPNMYHLSLMPCFDKKLEASRKDGEGEVDCVLTPKEFVKMLGELGLDFRTFVSDFGSFQRLSPPGWDPRVHWASSAGSSSGGYAYQYILGLQKSHPATSIVSLQGKNADVVEHRLLDVEGQVLGSSSEVYGFRNIQNVVRRLLTGTASKRNPKLLRRRAGATTSATKTNFAQVANPAESDFIEIMACPGGCINGGGLLSGEQLNPVQRKQLISDLNSKYNALESIDIPPQHIEERYVYKFHALEQPNDVVSVGNTW